ncbi:MAG TPA: OsmC family protein [Burkholderiales bacterium]|nr:OsmC family protein [Burkholderiales bacterium]
MSIRQAMEQMGAGIAADPARARSKPNPASARLTEGLKCEVSGQHGQRFLTDMPPAMGGAAAAPNPGWYLRGAIASCAATVIAMHAAKRGIRLDLLEVTVDTESDLRGILGLGDVAAGQKTVRTRVRIRGDADAETLRQLVTFGEGHSPVGCTLRDAPQFSLDIEVV